VRIAFAYDLVHPYSKGGVEKRIWRLSRLLADRGNEVHILGMQYWEGPDVVLRDGVWLHGVCDVAPLYDRRGRRSISQAWRFARGLFRALRRQDFDVVDVQNMAPMSCLAALIAAKLTRTKVLVTWHEVWGAYWGEYRGWQGRAGRLSEWLIAKGANHHAAVSPRTKRGLATLGVDRALISPNGVDLAELQSAGRSSGQWDAVYVGRLVDHKGLATLIEAVALLSRRGVVPKVAIVGEGPAAKALELQAINAELSNVAFLGRVETDREVYAIMSAARLFVLPSRREGFGLAALEACAAGTPIVTVDAPLNATAEFVENSHVGIVCDSSPEALASAIGRLLDDDALRRELAERAKWTASEYDWSVTASGLQGIYESILRSDSTPEPLATQTL
jgi:L-malate glycosyltransferase